MAGAYLCLDLQWWVNRKLIQFVVLGRNNHKSLEPDRFGRVRAEDDCDRAHHIHQAPQNHEDGTKTR